jgi:hypothetical protein
MMHTVGRRGHLMYHLKRLQKNYVKKKAIKHKKRNPYISSQPQVPPSKEFKNDCASMDGNKHN